MPASERYVRLVRKQHYIKIKALYSMLFLPEIITVKKLDPIMMIVVLLLILLVFIHIYY